MSHMTRIKECIESCSVCSAICYKMAMNHCLKVGGKSVAPELFKLLLNCAKINATFVCLLLNGPNVDTQLCIFCAEICDACAESCAHVDGLDGCVAACRKCAKCCRQMAA